MKRNRQSVTNWSSDVSATLKAQLEAIERTHRISLSAGDVQVLDGKWYITHSGLLQIAKKNHCNGIQTEVVSDLSDPQVGRWIVKATVYKTARSKGFVGYGDADPGNVSDLVRGAEMRVAETRAVNRALRKAYAVGLCSVEEIGATAETIKPGGNGNANASNGSDAQPARLRDRLLLLIRQHGLDADQVKAFAEAYCGNKPLREATREEITDFIEQLAQLVTKDREHALELLARYAVQRSDAAETPGGEATKTEAA